MRGNRLYVGLVVGVRVHDVGEACRGQGCGWNMQTCLTGMQLISINWSVPGNVGVWEHTYVEVGERDGVHWTFIKLHRGVVTGRGSTITQFIHSAVNWLWRPRVRERKQKAEHDC